ncbi:bifunctional glutathionylspermidine amidase/synthase [Simiduia agarivorans]|uniref:Bifunctional glutathionylspermidine amidase/glutathionylspermidine synthetase n=1 Tax=Simiduia agarivorans (strain DSM 21679 / JCM 13881 / BCRC 17597 / SA1) TaxID=1117647 RepID=K4KMR5_SIMAS|nr:bifunctional glutathionylspermidine amidase/synthase [Simiduia agarivorans]AFU99383.1 bifunctional glutathionylspermidine amidase/glutathionylspermidine synthetase [Simiduia agarivorans SA1 = DSM 21679]
MAHQLKFPPEPFGTLLGYAPGKVAIYSSHYPSANKAEYPDRQSYRSTLDGHPMGYKWQCVEFARRWLYQNYGYVFDDVPMAYDIFQLHHVTRLADDTLLPLRAFANGSLRAPEVGCLLIWAEGGEFEVTGHVAIITDIGPDFVRIAEQNVEHAKLPEGQHWNRQLRLERKPNGRFQIHEQFSNTRILGWMIQTQDDTHAQPPTKRDYSLFRLNSRVTNQLGQHTRPWLDEANKIDAAFIKAMGGHRLCESDSDAEHYRYFRMSETAEAELVRATNELHLMFMHATQAVLNDDKLLARFNIPKALWPRLRKSWENRRGQTVTGRFDFCMSDKGLKVYEYNADSASCHTEAGRIQGQWAKAFGVQEGTDPGAALAERITHAWKNSGAHGLLHIMQDNDAEESYHAQFIKAAAEAAGLQCKVIKGVSSLRWNSEGRITDAEGQVIEFVWKTWAWETALDQIRAECEDDDAHPNLRHAKDEHSHPRLVDVLLTPEVIVFEPFWTLIPSNKAILPILWQIFPNHPYLLNAQFQLTKDLSKQGYVSKPIAGRCGYNISLVDKNDQVLNETDGRFDEQDQIYQALWKLPEIDGYRVQLCTFTARGKYAGSCVRVDKSLIITTGSDLLPLRTVEDEKL